MPLKKFTTDEREIFHFLWPDKTPGRMDPLVVRRRLSQATQGRLDTLYEDLLAPLKDEDGLDIANRDEVVYRKYQAHEKMAVAVSLAFEVAIYDPETDEGTPQDWHMGIAVQFDEWLQKKSESGQTTSTSSPPPDGPPDATTPTSPT